MKTEKAEAFYYAFAESDKRPRLVPNFTLVASCSTYCQIISGNVSILHINKHFLVFFVILIFPNSRTKNACS